MIYNLTNKEPSIMTTTPKLPTPGEYWQSRSGETRLIVCDVRQNDHEWSGPYPIISINKSGGIATHDASGRDYNDTDESPNDMIEHLPDCTGFDWQPPALIDPGDGWEVLPVGTMREKGDEFTRDRGRHWEKTLTHGVTVDGSLAYRRRKPTAETWPKWYVRTSGADSWVYRADGRYTIRNLTCDCVADPAEWYWRHGNMVEITESEALARVKPAEPIDPATKALHELAINAGFDPLGLDPADIAEKLIAKQQVTGCHAESPDRVADNRQAREVIVDIVSWLDGSEFGDDSPAMALQTAQEWLADNPEDPPPFAKPFIDARSGMGIRKEQPAEPITQSVNSKITLAEAREAASRTMAESEAARCTAESPDDWVEITDGQHVLREGIDEVWYSFESIVNEWQQVFPSAGMRLEDSQYKKARCRRRDLPALTPFPDQFAAVTTAIRAKKEAPLPALIPGVATDRMVDLFLSWRLPSDFQPDGGISFTSRPIHESWPTGTNLFTASQARKMIEHLLSVPEEAAPAPQPKRTPVRLFVSADVRWGDRYIVSVKDGNPNPERHQEIKFDGSGFYVVEGE